MSQMPDTQASLILRIRDSEDADAWESFVRIYRPVVYRIARRRGLQHADADDLTQQVLASVTRAIPAWHPEPGTRFRHWLAKITRNAIVNVLLRDQRARGVGGSDFVEMLQSQPDQHAPLESQIELEYQRQIYRHAAEIVRAEVQVQTWLAFFYSVVQGQSTPSVAKLLDTTIGNVHAARSRVMRRLQTVVSSLLEVGS